MVSALAVHPGVIRTELWSDELVNRSLERPRSPSWQYPPPTTLLCGHRRSPQIRGGVMMMPRGRRLGHGGTSVIRELESFFKLGKVATGAWVGTWWAHEILYQWHASVQYQSGPHSNHDSTNFRRCPR